MRVVHVSAGVRDGGCGLWVPCEETTLVYFSVRSGVWFDAGCVYGGSHPLVANGFCGDGCHVWCVSVRALRVRVVCDAVRYAWVRPLVRSFCDEHMYLSDWLVNLL